MHTMVVVVVVVVVAVVVVVVLLVVVVVVVVACPFPLDHSTYRIPTDSLAKYWNKAGVMSIPPEGQPGVEEATSRAQERLR